MPKKKKKVTQSEKKRRKAARERAKIHFLDLGTGRGFERAAVMASRTRSARDGNLLRPRKIVAVDTVKPTRVAKGVEFVRRDAVDFLSKRPDRSIHIINSDFFFALHALRGDRPPAETAVNRTLQNPIDPELLEHIKRTLVPRGRLYASGSKWQMDALAEKLAEHGFESSSRQIGENELKSPDEIDNFYGHREGKMFRFFGPEGWVPHRLVAKRI